jgi:hypothetical protein
MLRRRADRFEMSRIFGDVLTDRRCHVLDRSHFGERERSGLPRRLSLRCCRKANRCGASGSRCGSELTSKPRQCGKFGTLGGTCTVFRFLNSIDTAVWPGSQWIGEPGSPRRVRLLRLDPLQPVAEFVDSSSPTLSASRARSRRHSWADTFQPSPFASISAMTRSICSRRTEAGRSTGT